MTTREGEVTTLEGEVARLRDEEAAPGSTAAVVKDLLRAAPTAAPSASSKARVRAALDERREPRRGLWLRPVVVLSLLLIGAAGASAARDEGWLGQTYRRLVAWVSPAAPAKTTAPASPAPASPAPATVPVLAPAAEPRPIESPAPAAERVVGARRAPRAALPGVTPVREASPTDDPTLGAPAVRALRREHDAARATQLLEDYLRRWPDGALAEEALALSIEAAQARGATPSAELSRPTDARARELAVRYLRRFPRGRFVETAHRALAGAAPPASPPAFE
jgi:hypothetical protein